MHFIVQFIRLRTILMFLSALNIAWAGSRPKNLDEHYNTTKQRRDRTSYPNRRRTQLYSRNSGKHVQILPNRGKVVARGDSGDRFAGLIILTVSFGKVQIKGVVTGRYICFDKRGHLISKRRPTSRCIFQETYGKDAFTQYASARLRGKFLAFNKNGNPRHRVVTKSGTKAVQFVERPKPRKMKYRYYRGKGQQRISERTLNFHKKLARQQARRSGSKLHLKKFPWTPPAHGFGRRKRGKNKNKNTGRSMKRRNDVMRKFKSRDKRPKNSQNAKGKNSWKYLSSSKETFRKLNRG